MNQRHSSILSLLADGKQVSVNEMSDVLEVSAATVRQDLTLLEKQGFLRRVHGGAVLDETDDIAHRMSINYERKLRIARAATQFVEDGETVFIESGSINAVFARELCSLRNITVITSNAFIARQIGKDSGSNAVLVGGVYQPESESLVGQLARLCVESLNFSKAFIGIDGFTAETGFSGRDMMRAELNHEVIKKSPEVFILTDSSKFGKIALSKYCSPEDVDCVITDSSIPADYSGYLTGRNIRLITV